MSESATAVAPEVNGVASHATAPKKASSPKTAKKAKSEPKEKVKLRPTQVRMLQMLNKKVSATRVELTIHATGRENGTLDATHLGAVDPKARKSSEARLGKPSLLTLGFVEEIMVETDSGVERRYKITASGKKWMKSK